MAFTHGHPIALSLVVDVLAQEERPGLADFTPEHAPDVMGELLARVVVGVPSERHRRALEVCALARLTTEALLDLIFVLRSNPFARPYWEWASFGQTYADALSSDDHEAVVAMTARRQGEESAALAAYWLGRQPDAFIALRGSDGALLGFVLYLTLTRASPEDVEADPGPGPRGPTRCGTSHPRPGEEVTHLRVVIDRDVGQRAASALNLVSVLSGRRWLTTPNLAWDFQSVPDEATFGPVFAYLSYDRVPEADFESAGGGWPPSPTIGGGCRPSNGWT